MLSSNEKLIIELLKLDPFLTQQEIADRLNINRSTVASLISNLMQKKVLLGRAYIMNQASKVICIGAMNIDRKLTIEDTVVARTSNPGTSVYSVGGVGRNICENLGRLGLDVSLISLAGNDADYDVIKKHSQSYIHMQYVKQLADGRTGNYNAILDNQGEMQIAVSDMSIYDQMTVEWIEEYQAVLKAAEVIVVDLNIPKDVIAYVIQLAAMHAIPLFIIPVSGPKMKRLPKDLKGVTWIIVNRDESEAFFNQSKNQLSIQALAKLWIQHGVKNVVITDGIHESYYLNESDTCFAKKPPICQHVKDVTGAGDSFAAGIIFGHLHNRTSEECLDLALTNAYHTIQSEMTVRTDLSETLIYQQVTALKEKGELK